MPTSPRGPTIFCPHLGTPPCLVMSTYSSLVLRIDTYILLYNPTQKCWSGSQKIGYFMLIKKLSFQKNVSQTNFGQIVVFRKKIPSPWLVCVGRNYFLATFCNFSRRAFQTEKKLGSFFSFWRPQRPLAKWTVKIKKNTFGNLILDLLLDFKSTWKKMKPSKNPGNLLSYYWQ
jgi:hypothetical protein